MRERTETDKPSCPECGHRVIRTTFKTAQNKSIYACLSCDCKFWYELEKDELHKLEERNNAFFLREREQCYLLLPV